MGAEVNEVINNLCEKLGVTSSFLIPEITKYRITCAACDIAMYLIMIAVAVFVIRITYKPFLKLHEKGFSKRSDSEDSQCFLYAACIIGLLVAIFILSTLIFCRISIITTTIVSPTVSAISYVMKLVK